MTDMSDDELAAVAKRARERRAREVGPSRPMVALGTAVGTAKAPSAVSRVRCPSCGNWALPFELEADKRRCNGCRRIEADKAERIAGLLERIPDVYRPRGYESLERPPAFLSMDAVRIARAWIGGKKPRLSIFGHETGSGKSSLAACAMASAIERGAAPKWIHAIDFVDDDPARVRWAFETIQRCPFVVLDGLGKEFGGGRFDSYEADVPRGRMIRVFTHIHQARGQRFVLTFDLTDRALAGATDPKTGEHYKGAYDASVLRRVMNEEFADVITLTRNGPLRVANVPRAK